MIDERQKATAMSALTTYMARHKMRKTPERFAIYSRVLSMPDHFVVDDLYAVMEQDEYHVSRATIYNTVNMLVDAGLLLRHKFGERHAVYERVNGAGVHHHHLICSQCGKIREITDPEIDSLLARKSYGSFSPLFSELNIYGLCRSCQKKGRKSAGKPAPGGKDPA